MSPRLSLSHSPFSVKHTKTHSSPLLFVQKWQQRTPCPSQTHFLSLHTTAWSSLPIDNGFQRPLCQGRQQDCSATSYQTTERRPDYHCSKCNRFTRRREDAAYNHSDSPGVATRVPRRRICRTRPEQERPTSREGGRTRRGRGRRHRVPKRNEACAHQHSLVSLGLLHGK